MKFAFGGATAPSLGEKQERAKSRNEKKKPPFSILYADFPSCLQSFH
jgi:hypothetical protein